MFSSTRASPGGNYKHVYTNFSYSLQTGTLEERGIIKWRETDDSVKVGGTSNTSVYDLPFIQKYLNRLTITRFLPFCANFQPCSVTCKRENPTLEHYEQSVEDTKFWDFLKLCPICTACMLLLIRACQTILLWIWRWLYHPDRRNSVLTIRVSGHSLNLVWLQCTVVSITGTNVQIRITLPKIVCAIHVWLEYGVYFSSTDPKAQVSFS